MTQTSSPITRLPMIDRALLARLIEVAEAAGAAILPFWTAPGEARRADKVDGTPVTDADHAADAVILSRLPAILPGLPIVSEETLPETAPAPDATFILVDPLDGTRDFLRGSGDFTVNIAIVADRRTIVGVIHAPIHKRTFVGAAGLGAFETTGGIWRPIHVRACPRAGATVVGSRRHAERGDGTLVERVPMAEHRAVGSSLKFCLLAAGEADLYPRHGRTMEWDTAAGQAILEAAGGRVSTLDGVPLAYGNPEFRNTSFIARGGV